LFIILNKEIIFKPYKVNLHLHSYISMGKNNTSFNIDCKHGSINFSTPKVMGILNVTPDSFYDGGKNDGISKAVEKAIQMIEQGADIIDIGGQSTRPNATQISATQELDRIATVVEAIRNYNQSIIISVDTFYSEVAKNVVPLGADIINDISAGSMDNKMLATIGKLNVPYIAMHIQGTPATMQINPTYNNVTLDVFNYFQEIQFICKEHKIKKLIIDPGFGFGKTTKHNFELLKNLSTFSTLQLPLLVGLSRKGMIYKTLNTTAENALNGTTALHMVALQNGANILRVHDVLEAKQTITLFNELQNA
jgi:dihydropteroate synthase